MSITVCEQKEAIVSIAVCEQKEAILSIIQRCVGRRRP